MNQTVMELSTFYGSYPKGLMVRRYDDALGRINQQSKRHKDMAYRVDGPEVNYRQKVQRREEH